MKKIYRTFVFCAFLVLFGWGCKKQAENIPNFISKSELKPSFSYSYNDVNQIRGEVLLAEKMKNTPTIKDNEKKEVNGTARGMMMADDGYVYSAMLEDVVGGEASGLVKAGYKNNEYNFYASFANLYEPKDGQFYEGWLVRKEPFAFISTGKVEKIGGIYNNLYKTNMNLSQYDFYVLTWEQNDNDPAPGKHVLEGVLKKQK